MYVEAPTFYTESGPPSAEDNELVSVRLPADVVDELMLNTVWLSVELEHRIPRPALLRALLLAGLAHPRCALAELRGTKRHDATLVALLPDDPKRLSAPDGDDPALE